jgi:NADH:ubiquinone oxidoreductase subunit E
MEATLQKLLEEFRRKEGNLLTLLQDTQDAFGYLPQDAIYWFAGALDVPPSRFFGIATYYAQFYLKPRGTNVLTVCCGTACHVKGAERLVNAARTELKLPEGEETTHDRSFTLEKLSCLGTCGMAPVVVVNKKLHGKMTPDKVVKEIRAIQKEQA